MQHLKEKRALVKQAAEDGLIAFEWFLPLTIQGNGTDEMCNWLVNNVSFRLLKGAYVAMHDFRNWESDQEEYPEYDFPEPKWFKHN